MDFDDLTPGRDFYGFVDDGDLDLAAAVFETDAVVGGSERHVARGINLAGDRLTNRRLAGTRPLRFRPAGLTSSARYRRWRPTRIAGGPS